MSGCSCRRAAYWLNINGQLYNSFLSPSAQTALSRTATGGIAPGPKTPVDDANVSLFAKLGQLVGVDGSLVNGSLTASYGTLTLNGLNGDSSDTSKGSQLLALNGSTVVTGDDGAFGDANLDGVVNVLGDGFALIANLGSSNN